MARRGSRSEQSASNPTRNFACNSSSSSSIQRFKRCRCGERAILFTARTPQNFGRMFWRCPNWMMRKTCNYYQWVDEDNEDESGNDVVGYEADPVEDSKVEDLKWKISKLKMKLNAERLKGKFMIGVIVVSWLLLIMLGVTSVMKCYG